MTPTAMAEFAGVWKRGLTWPSHPPAGKWPSRPIENISRVAAPWIAIVQTKTDARMTSRYSSPNEIPNTMSCVKAPVMIVPIG